jgi:hypothetical protein
MKSTTKIPAKPKLTDAERYKRFLDAAKAVGASDDAKDFDRAFRRVVHPAKRDVTVPPSSPKDSDA